MNSCTIAQMTSRRLKIAVTTRIRKAASLLIALMLLSLIGSPHASAYGLASISIGNASLMEGDSGSVNMIFPVTRTGDMTSTIVVDYTTQDGSALSGTDYITQTGALIIPSGEASSNINVPVIGNSIVQGNRSFSVVLTGVVNTYGPPVSFGPQQIFDTDNNPWSVVVGDFNGDDRPDLASANYGFNSVSVLLNTTAPGAITPTFAPQFLIRVNGGPISLAIDDFNGDGRLDLAIANQVSSTVSILLNTTAPGQTTLSFATQQTFDAGADPVSIVVGDFNHDGKPDLASANYGSNTISVLLNTTALGSGTPSFATQQVFYPGDYPLDLAVSDFNGDGKLDLACANPASNTISVLFNTTAPSAATLSFAPRQAFVTGTYPAFVVVGDLNNDGRPDLASADYASNTVSVLINTTVPGASTPSFSAQQTFGAGGQPASLVVDDFNSDGKPDLACANYGSDTVSVLLNMTAPGAIMPSFATQQTFSTGNNSSPNSVTAGDFNSDGKPDLASANFNSNNVSVLLNTTTLADGPLAFTSQQAFATDYYPMAVTVGDFNGDGKSDLVSANYLGNTVSVLLNTTAPGEAMPTFGNQQAFSVGLYPSSAAVGDFNSDGKPDLAIGNRYSNTLSVLLNTANPGATAPSFAIQQTFATESYPWSVAVGDFNGDGRPDLASANEYSNTVSVLINNTTPGAATPAFTTQQSFSLGATGTSPHSVAVEDFNGDGRPDLATANYDGHTVSVLLNITTPGAALLAFANPQSFGVGNNPYSVAIGDFNGDGKPDLASANYASNTVSVLLNASNLGATVPSFTAQQAFSVGAPGPYPYPIQVTVGDFNGDGRPDLASANADAHTISVLINTTVPGANSPSFANQGTFGGEAQGMDPLSVAVGDYNSDGRIDLAAGNYGYSTITVLLSQATALTPGTGTIIDDDAPASMTIVSGDNQSAQLITTFATPLAVEVKNAAGHLVQGASVTFTAPSNGPSGTFASSPTVTSNASGRAIAPSFTANSITGVYQVTASTAGLTVKFSLENWGYLSYLPIVIK